MAMAQPTAMSAALPVASWCTAKEQLMPAPFTSLPCSYSRRTDGPMPCDDSSCKVANVTLCNAVSVGYSDY